jgi:hypothetical protein
MMVFRSVEVDGEPTALGEGKRGEWGALAPGQEGIDAVLHLNQQGQAAMADLVQRRIPVLATPASL